MRKYIWPSQKYKVFYLIFTEIWGKNLVVIIERYFEKKHHHQNPETTNHDQDGGFNLFSPIQGHFWRGGNVVQLIWKTLFPSSHLSGALSSSPSTWRRAPRSGSPTLFWETRFCRRFFFSFFFFREVNSFPHCQLLAACPKNCLERDLDKNPFYSLTSRWQRHWGYLCFVDLIDSCVSMCVLSFLQ